MKAWLATGVTGLGAGLGKMDILVIPRENGNSLAVHVTGDGRIWIAEEEMEGQPTPENQLKEVDVPEKLAEEVDFSFSVKKGSLTQHAKNLLLEFVSGISQKKTYAKNNEKREDEPMQSAASMPTQEQVLEYLEAGKRKAGYETNFAVKKFIELPIEKQREIWEQIRNGDRDQRTEAARTLINLVVDDLDGMTKFLNETLYDGEDVFDAWLIMPDDVPDKAEYIFIYFMTHLEQSDGGFAIKALD